MSFWIAAFLLIPLADQAIKARLRQRLGDRVVSLGPLGSLRVIDAPIWWARPARECITCSFTTRSILEGTPVKTCGTSKVVA